MSRSHSNGVLCISRVYYQYYVLDVIANKKYLHERHAVQCNEQGTSHKREQSDPEHTE